MAESKLDREHSIGDIQCTVGWCGGLDYPKKCTCGGLIHAEYDDQDMDNLYLNTECDKCGKPNNGQ